MRRVKHYLGIDPGVNGALCILRIDGTPLEWTRMPDGRGRIIDRMISMHGQYKNLTMIVELAQPMPKQGIVSSFSYGRHFGIYEDTAIMLKIPYAEVRPNVWKKFMGLTSKKVDSISACRRLFPMVDLIPTGCRTQHHGIAEAMLIGEFARRKNI